MAFDFDTLERYAELNRKISECKRKKRECQKKIGDYEAAINKVRQAQGDYEDAADKERQIDDYREELGRLIKSAAKGDPVMVGRVYSRGSIVVGLIGNIYDECEMAIRYWSQKIAYQNNKISNYNIQIQSYEYEKSLL